MKPEARVFEITSPQDLVLLDRILQLLEFQTFFGFHLISISIKASLFRAQAHAPDTPPAF